MPGPDPTPGGTYRFLDKRTLTIAGVAAAIVAVVAAAICFATR
jgi:hypothetical protein